MHTSCLEWYSGKCSRHPGTNKKNAYGALLHRWKRGSVWTNSVFLLESITLWCMSPLSGHHDSGKNTTTLSWPQGHGPKRGRAGTGALPNSHILLVGGDLLGGGTESATSALPTNCHHVSHVHLREIKAWRVHHCWGGGTHTKGGVLAHLWNILPHPSLKSKDQLPFLRCP